MKDIFKLCCLHFLLIVAAVLFGTAIVNIFNGTEGVTYSWSYPFQILITGIIGALPTLLYYFKDEPTKKQFLIRSIIHFFVLTSLIMGVGALFQWYTSINGALIVLCVFIFVYVFVWLGTEFMDKKTASNINEALKKYQSEDKDEK